MKKQTLITMALSVALALSLTANIVMWAMWPETPSSDDDKGSVVVLPQDDVGESTQTTVTKEMLSVDTPYATLQYPAQFAAYLHHEASEDNGVYTHTFFCRIGDDTVEMFRVIFGDPTAGSLIGYVDKNGEEVAFCVASPETPISDAWTSEESDRYKKMLMGVNDVIESVRNDSRFKG